MICYVVVAPDGRVVLSGVAPVQALEQLPPMAQGVYHQVAAPVAPDTVWWRSGRLETLPPRPSPEHQFDPQRWVWALSIEAAWAQVRAKRDRLLAETDWRVVKAQEEGQALPPAWRQYRQALRDVTQQGDPQAIVWPVAPGG